MNFWNLCDPAYAVQVNFVMNFISPIMMKGFEYSCQHSLLLIPFLVLNIFLTPFYVLCAAWILHPLAALIFLIVMTMQIAEINRKDKLKKEGKWTAQDETNDLINEMDWNNIMMQKQILEKLESIAANTKRK